MYHIFSTIHSKYQGETMFCFVCVATVFGYILGVNRVIDAIISKHSDETRVKVVKTMNKYTQTNLGEIAELLASNNIIIPLNNQTNMPCSIDDSHDNSNNSHDDIRSINIETNEMNTMLMRLLNQQESQRNTGSQAVASVSCGSSYENENEMSGIDSDGLYQQESQTAKQYILLGESLN